MILSKAAYNLLNLISGGRGTNNTPYSIEQIIFTIEYYRALFVRRELGQNARTFEHEQDLGLIPVEMVDPAEGVIPVFRGHILRTIGKIPTPLNLRGRTGITAVMSPDRRYQFPIIDYQQARWQKYNKFTGLRPRSFLLNGDIYVIADPLTEAINDLILGEETLATLDQSVFLEGSQCITVRGVFEDPRAAFEFANDKEFDDDVDEYPLPLDMYQRIADGILKGELKVLDPRDLDTEPDQLPDDA